MEEIKKGDGPYNMDPMKHAENCIKNMVNIATEALSKEEVMPDAFATRSG